MTPTLNRSRHRPDTFLASEPLLRWSLPESEWARGMAHPQVVSSDHLPVRLFQGKPHKQNGVNPLKPPASHIIAKDTLIVGVVSWGGGGGGQCALLS